MDHTTNTFLLGSWVSFYSFDKDSYTAQLDRMKEIGLNFNIFPMVFGSTAMSPADWDTVEREYAARDMYYLMVGGMREEDVPSNVAMAKDRPHCIGYHIMDEPSGNQLPHVGQICRRYRESDPQRYPFVNLFPSYVGEPTMGGSYDEYVSRFVKEVRPENIEYLSHDYYPCCANETRFAMFRDMETIRRVAQENGLRTHAFPQSTAWNGMRMPSLDDMRWNAYAYLAYGFKGLSWFNLVCPGSSDTEGEGFRESILYRDGEIHDRELYDGFVTLNHELAAVGSVLIHLECLHAYHTRAEVDGVELLPEDGMIGPDRNSNLVVSHMVHRQTGEPYLMLFHKDLHQPQTVPFRVRPDCPVKALSYYDPFTSEWRNIAVTDGGFSETFRPGEGKLYRLILTQDT